MKRITGIIVAGMLTGTVLVTVLALGIRNVVRANNPTTNVPSISEPVVIEQTVPVNGDAASAGLQADQQTQVDQLLATMAEREQAYQAQLEAANQTIQQLQAQPQPNTGRHVERENEEFEGFFDD